MATGEFKFEGDPMEEWKTLGHYETSSGDRVTLMELRGQWAICWSYGYPHNGLQVVSYGEHGGKAIEVFTTSREGKALAWDSRTEWQNGSV
jgi:hypothetical protein